MKLRVLKAKSKGDALKVLSEDWAKRTGAVLRETIGSFEGPFVVVKGDENTIKKFLETGAFEVPENEGELVEEIKKEEEAATAGVGLLGL